MMEKLRKIIIFLIMFVEVICITNTAFAKDNEFVVSGSFGTKTLIIPEGTTIEEAYVEMAKLYLEEKADNEKLISQLEDIIQKSNDYEVTSLKLKSLQEDLNEKNKELIKLYQEITKPVLFSPLIDFGITTSEFKKIDGMSLGLGVEILEKAMLSCVISYPFSIGIRAGVKF